MKRVSVLMATAFIDMLGVAMVFPLVPFYALRLKAEPWMIGWIIAAFSIAQLASSPVWGRVSDHERTPTWVKRGLRSVHLIEPGTPQPGGTGAVRAVKFAGWPTVQERIVRFDEGSCFESRVMTGMPHLDEAQRALFRKRIGTMTWGALAHRWPPLVSELEGLSAS